MDSGVELNLYSMDRDDVKQLKSLVSGKKRAPSSCGAGMAVRTHACMQEYMTAGDMRTLLLWHYNGHEMCLIV